MFFIKVSGSGDVVRYNHEMFGLFTGNGQEFFHYFCQCLRTRYQSKYSKSKNVFFLRHNFPHIQQYLFHLQIIFPFPIIVRVSSSSGRRFCSKIKGKTEDSFYCWFRQLPHGIIHRLFSFTYQNQILYTRYRIDYF